MISRLAAMQQSYTQGQRAAAARDFIDLARAIMCADVRTGGPAGAAERHGAAEDVLDVLRSVGAAPLLQLGDYAAMQSAWLATLRNSAFDVMLPAMARVPRLTRGGLVTLITGGAPAEGAGKLLSSLDLIANGITPQKAAAIVIGSRELIDAPDFPLGALNTELGNAVALATDQRFITALLAGATSIASTGTAVHDLALLLESVPRGASSRPFFVGGVSTRDQASLITESLGRSARLPVAGGGSLLDIPFVTSDALTSTTLVLADASRVAAFDDGLVLDRADHASLHLADTQTQSSTSPPTEAADLLSLWQTNSVALRGERTFGIRKLESAAVAQLTAIEWLAPGQSPPLLG